jgi:hypothetical protein
VCIAAAGARLRVTLVQGKVIIIEGAHVDPAQFLMFSKVRCVFVPVLIMPAHCGAPRSLMQRCNIVRHLAHCTALSDTQKLQVYENNVQWLRGYLSAFSDEMYCHLPRAFTLAPLDSL